MHNQLDLTELRAHLQADHPALVQQGMVEAAHYNLHGELPPDAVVLERIEWIGENVLIVHQDPDAVRQ